MQPATKLKLMTIWLMACVVGAGTLAAVRAQGAKKPAYIIANVEITDQAAYQAYAAKVPDTLKPFNGRIVARGKPSPKEGATPQGIVVLLEFDSLADADKWWSSPAYSALIPERQKSAKAQIFALEGLPQ